MAQRAVGSCAMSQTITKRGDVYMATKKTASKSSSQGVVGILKQIVTGKSGAPPARPKTKKSTTVKAKSSAKAKTKQASQAKPSRKPKKAAPATETKSAPGVKDKAARTVPEQARANDKVVSSETPVKKKPPSITITRPEVTRPPVVLPPPRPLEAPIGAPSILLPKGGLPITSLTPILRWMYVGGATEYEVEWSPDPNFARGRSVTAVARQTAITLDSSNQLKPSTNYKWRVRGGNEAGWGPWSHPESFRSPEK